MTPDEQRILEFLQTTEDFLSARHIGLSAGPPVGSINPTWAQPFLIRLTRAGILDMNLSGEFRLKPAQRFHFAANIAETLARRKAA